MFQTRTSSPRNLVGFRSDSSRNPESKVRLVTVSRDNVCVQFPPKDVKRKFVIPATFQIETISLERRGGFLKQASGGVRTSFFPLPVGRDRESIEQSVCNQSVQTNPLHVFEFY